LGFGKKKIAPNAQLWDPVVVVVVVVEGACYHFLG
jgi:hypothetical protein